MASVTIHQAPQALTSNQVTLDGYLSQTRIDDSDLMFLVFATQIQKMDQLVKDQIQQIRFKSHLRDEISAHLDQLRDLHTLSKKVAEEVDNDEKITLWQLAIAKYSHQSIKSVQQKLEDGDQATLDQVNAWVSQLVKEYPAILANDLVIDLKTGIVSAQAQEPSKTIFTGKDHDMMTVKIGDKQVGLLGTDLFTPDRIDMRIQQLTNKIQELDSDREIGMIQLNSWLNKKSQFTQLWSNLAKSNHDSLLSIINNMR